MHIFLSSSPRAKPTMRRLLSTSFLPFLLGVVLLGSSSAYASYRDYLIAWQSISYKGLGSCLDLYQLNVEGAPHFQVNAVPIPTRTIPGNFVGNTQIQRNLFGAPFNSTLLRWGQNHFFFETDTSGGGRECTISDEIVTLQTGGFTARPLFTIKRIGTKFEGVSEVSLSLREINPGLSDNIMRLEDALERRKLQLVSIYGSIEAAKAEIALLDKLRAEIDELSKRPLDSISEQDLKNILDKYAGIDPGVYNALVQLLRDLKGDLEALRAELNRIITDFRGQMAGLDDLLLSAPPAGAPDLDSSGTYIPDMDTGSLPDVEIPDVGVGDDFDENQDPYRAYAQRVLEQLQGTEANGEVMDRGAFLSIVRSWRQNQAAFEQSILSRGVVSQEEVGAFLNAQQMVLTHVRNFMDEEGWFHDTPVRPTTRSLIAYLRQRQDAAAQAEALQAQLNYWRGSEPSLQQKLILDSLDALFGGWQSVEAGAMDEDPSILSKLLSIGDSAEVIIKEVALFGIGFTPVGDFIDFCEVVTGWETCNPNGKQLTTGERMITTLGIVGGSGKFWRFVATSTVSAVAMTVMKNAAELIERWWDIRKERRLELLNLLGEDVIKKVTNISGKEMEHLLTRLGSPAVKKLGAHLDGKALQELEKLSMLELPGRVIDHVLTKGQSVKRLDIVPNETLVDFEKRLTDMKFKSAGLGENGDKIWVHSDFSVVRIAQGNSTTPPYYRKEITLVAGQYNRDAIAAKVTGTISEGGDAVLSPPEWSELTTGAGDQVRDWFASKLNKDPDEIVSKYGSELETMRNWWVSQTHFNLNK